MNFIRRKAFFLSYLGALLFILSTFVPIVKIDNQTVAFIDQFLYLSIAIGVFSTLIIIFTTIKQHKLSLIPTFLNIGIVAFGIYKIMTIENLQVTINLDLGSYGVAFILYPVAAIISLLGALLTKKQNIENKNIEVNKNLTDSSTYVEEIPQNIEESNASDILLDDVEQIPLSNIKQTVDNPEYVNDSLENEKTNSSIDGVMNFNNIIEKNNELEINNEQNFDIKDDFGINNNSIINENNNIEIDNNETLNSEKNLDNKTSFEEITNLNNTVNANIAIEKSDIENNLEFNEEEILSNDLTINEEILFEEIDEVKNIHNEDNGDNEITEVHISDLNDDDLVNNVPISNNEFANITDNNNEEIVFEDIIEKNSESENELDKTPNYEQEVPDISMDDNFMTNNIQSIDEPEKQFMAINPSDIKIDEKKSLFKKKEKKEEDPLEKIMNRNIPTTLGRKCQFCSTQLGDDERICPLCGRIN